MWLVLLIVCQAESGRVWVYPLRMAYAGVSVSATTRDRTGPTAGQWHQTRNRESKIPFP